MRDTPAEECPFSVASTSSTFWYLFNKLRRDEPFVHSRFGDGEYEIMLGGGAALQSPDPQLGDELRELYDNRHPDNLVACAMHQPEEGMVPGLFAPWTNPRYNTLRHLRWYENAIALHYYAVFRPHALRWMFDLVRDRPKVFLGPHTSDAMQALIGHHALVQVPSVNAYSTIGEWYPVLARAVELYREGVGTIPLVITACGPSGRAANLRLLKGQTPLQLLDIGSVRSFADGDPTHTWVRMAPPGAREVLLGHTEK